MNWAMMKIGPVITSRFTTTQARVVWMCLNNINLSFEFYFMMHYMVYIWLKVLFVVQHHKRFVDACQLLEVMLTSKHCSYPEKTLPSKLLSHNGYIDHPENVTILASPKVEERKTAFDIIFSNLIS